VNPSRTRPSDENEGVIVGRDGALVVDAGINGAVSEQIQQIVATLTDKPIRFLVNTTYHCDHSFGN
jgi:cyclase